MMRKKKPLSFFLGMVLLLVSLTSSCGTEPASPARFETIETEGAAPLEPEVTTTEQIPQPEPESEDTNRVPQVTRNKTLTPYSDAWLLWFWDTLTALREEYPDGSYWNHIGHTGDYIGVTNTPCNHAYYGISSCNIYNCVSTEICGWGYGTQCAAFAGLLSDRVFGKDAPVRVFCDYDELQPGDQARLDGDTHSVFILTKTDTYVTVAECNAEMNNCRIDWGRIIPREQMGGFYLRRVSE